MMEVRRGSSRATLTAVCGLVAALLFGTLSLPTRLAPGDSMPRLLEREAIWWACAAVILLWLRFAERLPFRSIGFRRPTWKTFVFGFVAFVMLIAILVLEYAVLVPMLHIQSDRTEAVRQSILNTPLWYRIVSVLRAAVVEEILFRGYLIEKVQQLTGSTVLAVVVSVAAFSYAHLAGWGVVHLIPVAAGGLVLAMLYVWRRDLPSNILAHFLVDGAGFFFG